MIVNLLIFLIKQELNQIYYKQEDLAKTNKTAETLDLKC